MLELKSISAGYKKTTVLTNLSLELRKGEMLSVVGLNGCGKSTLLKTAAGLLRPLAGEVLVDGTPLSELKSNGAAQRLSYLSQGKATPDMTVGQLVLHGRFPYLGFPRVYRGTDKELAEAAMRKMGIEALAERPLSTLSGGMRQKAYIAMALCQDTDYILLDEPTTYLDVSAQLELTSTLRELAGLGKGIVTVTHDLPLALSCSDRVALLDGGTLAAVGTPDEVLRSGKLDTVFGVKISRSENGGYFYEY